jgi:YHS domain-containing protein
MIAIVRLIITALIIYLAYKAIRWLLSGGKDISKKAKGYVTQEDLVEDPCCHRYIPVSESVKYHTHEETKHFCSEECLNKYKTNNEIK